MAQRTGQLFMRADNQKVMVATALIAADRKHRGFRAQVTGDHPRVVNIQNLWTFITLPSRHLVYLSAHDHSMQWLQPTCNGTELLVSGAGASTTELPGSNAVHFQTLALGFVYFVVQDSTLTAEFYDTAGTRLFSRTLSK